MNYTDYYQHLNENQQVNELLSGTQNKALHIIYTKCRDALKEILDICKSKGVTASNYMTLFPSLFEVVSLSKSKKLNSGYEHDRVGNKFTLKVELPPEILKVFPYLSFGQPHILILFMNHRAMPSTSAGVITQDKIPQEILINTFNFLHMEWTDFCSVLQHELQHIADLHDPEIENLMKDNIPTTIVESFEDQINYFSSPVEITAHAKQLAYVYTKLFPDDKKISLDKILSIFDKYSSVAFSATFYLPICYDPIGAKKSGAIPSNFKLTQEIVDKLRKIHFEFKRELTRSLNYFVKVPAKFELEEMWVGW